MKFTSGIIVMGSGSVGGATYSHNRYGMYIRNRSVPVNPQSSRQSVVRSLLADLAQDWSQTLTAAQRAQWDAYAANVPVINSLGATVYVTGFNMYIRTNVPNLQSGLTRIDPGPVIFTKPGEDATLGCTLSAATQIITVSYDDTRDWCDDDGGAMIISAGRPVNPTINFYGGPWRFADAIEGDSVAPPASPQTVACPFTVQEGQKVFVQARILRADGRLSDLFRTDLTVAA